MDVRPAPANKTGRAYRDSQRVAYLLERYRPVFDIVKNPGLSFPEFPLPGGIMCFEITLKTSHRINQDGGHQTHDRRHRSRTPPRREKLCGHKGIGAKR